MKFDLCFTQMIDRQSDRLLREVKVARQQREEEVSRRKQDVQLNRLTLINFQQYSEHVKDKGTVVFRPTRRIFIIYLFICLFVFASVCVCVCLPVGSFVFISVVFTYSFVDSSIHSRLDLF